MRTLGGYSKVITDCIEQVLHQAATNPRAQPLLDLVRVQLKAQLSEIRIQTQTMLCRVQLPWVAARSGRSSGARYPLTEGVFTEIEFRVPQLNWKGKADLLVLSPVICELTDFKTGISDDSHRFQIRVYALLWQRDNELNPSSRKANRLILFYKSGNIEVPALTEDEFGLFEREVMDRGQAARASVDHDPIQARPSVDTCRHCEVRHLCEDYWTERIQRQFADASDRKYGDAQITILRRHGSSSWDAEIEISSATSISRKALLRTNTEDVFRCGERLRILDVGVSIDGDADAQTVVFTAGKLSETYVLP
jgi:hypothetical protein